MFLIYFGIKYFYNFFFRCLPRLNEGDQVIMINGRDISQHTHDQVVNFIRASSEPHSAQLELAVRQVKRNKNLFSRIFPFHEKIYCIINTNGIMNFEISRMRTWVKPWKSPNSNMYLTPHTLVLWSQEPKLYLCICIY